MGEAAALETDAGVALGTRGARLALADARAAVAAMVLGAHGRLRSGAGHRQAAAPRPALEAGRAAAFAARRDACASGADQARGALGVAEALRTGTTMGSLPGATSSAAMILSMRLRFSA